MTTSRRLTSKRLVSVVTLERGADAVPMARALLAGGLDVMEITLRTEEALEGIRRIAAEVPEMLVGAGTVLSVRQLDQLAGAGARFGVAPGLNPEVVREAAARELPFIPGIMTPSEVEQAAALGCRLLKFFPAEALGGARTLKVMAAPYTHLGLQYLPLGGVNAQNMAAYLALPSVAAVGGSWLTDPALVRAGDWDAVAARTREALDLCARAD